MRAFLIEPLHRAANLGEYEPIVLFAEGELAPLRVNTSAQLIAEALFAHNFDPDKDVLVLAGRLVLLFLAGAVLGDSCDKVQLLVWDSVARRYYPRSLTMIEEMRVDEIAVATANGEIV